MNAGMMTKRHPVDNGANPTARRSHQANRVSLAVMRFTPQFLDEIRARLPVSQVVARKVALKKAGREYKGLSPFKVEKSPSFFVNDLKGFYHCFASGAHGDIFKFVMETEGLTFPEVVERLASEAGVPMPVREDRSPEAEARQDERTRLYALLDTSVLFFEEQLRGLAGQEARRYIEKRGLRRETIESFRLGFAPNGRTALKEHLASHGFSDKEAAISGMLITGEDIPVPYDRFRNRVMFPIQDAKGRTIAFGGRALAADVPAKYLNSPETPLFHKGAVLFNAHRARPLAFDRDRVIAVEGYMDVIALSEAGFGESVAPLGTALTEGQVQLLWQMTPVPTLCFDGDSAGRKAAFRAVETVLPHLKPGFSVQFAFLPDGLDPDDLIRQQGKDAFETVLKSRIRPLIDVLVEKEQLAGNGTQTPEERASLEKRLKILAERIGDTGVRIQYEKEIRQILWERQRREVRQVVGSGGRRSAEMAGKRRNNTQLDWRVRERQRLQKPGQRPPPPPMPVTASNELSTHAAILPAREARLLRALMTHPWLIAEQAEAISDLTFTLPALNELRDALLSYVADDKPLDSAEISAHLTCQGLAKVIALVERAITHKGDKFAEPEADRAAVETGWRHAVALHRKEELRREMEAARQAWDAEGSEDAFARIRELHALLNRSDGAEAASEIAAGDAG